VAPFNFLDFGDYLREYYLPEHKTILNGFDSFFHWAMLKYSKGTSYWFELLWNSDFCFSELA
jgi:hypothetical protein